MELSVMERLLALQLPLPRQGDLTTLRIVRQLQDDLSFSEEEHERLKFVHDGNTTRWNSKADEGRDIEIGPKARELLLEGLESLDKVQQLTLEHLSLIDKLGYEGQDGAEDDDL